MKTFYIKNVTADILLLDSTKFLSRFASRGEHPIIIEMLHVSMLINRLKLIE